MSETLSSLRERVKDRFAAELGIDAELTPEMFVAAADAFEDCGMSDAAAFQAAIDLYQISFEQGIALLSALDTPEQPNV